MRKILYGRAVRTASAALALASLITAISDAHAARPMSTDDARIVDAKACQLESWAKNRKESTEYWLQPACNFTGNLELTLGSARTIGKGENAGQRSTDWLVQGKTLFRELEPNGWAWGLAVGNVRHPSAPGSGAGDIYAYVPVTFSLRDDRLLLHTNVGWLREDQTHRQRMTWGLATEAQLSPGTWLIAEAFGQNQGRPYYHMGVRHWLVPNHVQIDATFGNRMGSGAQERWLSIGLRLLSLPCLH